MASKIKRFRTLTTNRPPVFVCRSNFSSSAAAGVSRPTVFPGDGSVKTVFRTFKAPIEWGARESVWRNKFGKGQGPLIRKYCTESTDKTAEAGSLAAELAAEELAAKLAAEELAAKELPAKDMKGAMLKLMEDYSLKVANTVQKWVKDPPPPNAFALSFAPPAGIALFNFVFKRKHPMSSKDVDDGVTTALYTVVIIAAAEYYEVGVSAARAKIASIIGLGSTKEVTESATVIMKDVQVTVRNVAGGVGRLEAGQKTMIEDLKDKGKWFWSRWF